MSNNLEIAEDQQERLDAKWLVGFADGEGSFAISFIKNESMRFGYQIFTEFVITQGEKSLDVLESIQKFFGCGNIYVNRRHDNHRENIYRYCVRNRKDLLGSIIPFFKKHQLLTSKKNDFKIFSEVVAMIEKREHLSEKGFEKIRILASKTNRQKKRLESPTTDTPESPKSDKIQSDLYGDIEVASEYTEITIKTI